MLADMIIAICGIGLTLIGIVTTHVVLLLKAGAQQQALKSSCDTLTIELRRLSKKYDVADTRMSGIDDRIDGLDRRVDNHEFRIDALEKHPALKGAG